MIDESAEEIILAKSLSITEIVIAQVTDPIDLEFLELILYTERKIEPFAKIPGISDFTKSKKVAEVKIYNDRLKANLIGKFLILSNKVACFCANGGLRK
jgi:hypothetical protein